MNKKYLISKILAIAFGISTVWLLLSVQGLVYDSGLSAIWLQFTYWANFIGLAAALIFYIYQKTIKDVEESRDDKNSKDGPWKN